jgi:hypothetical protein
MNEMLSYWSERFGPRVFVPAAALIALAAQTGTALDPLRWMIATPIALSLVAQFRLWDDLADRERDRETHPERTLVRAESVAPFAMTCAGLAAVNVLLLLAWNGLAGAASLAALDGAAVAWYLWRPKRRTASSDLALLAKYPAFVVLLAPSPAWPLPSIWIAALATYAGACAFEAWHDSSGPLRVWFNQ